MDRDSRENHFWNNYLAVLAECHIKSSLYTWYVRHCEAFIRANKDIRLKQNTKETVSAYLSKLINSDLKAAWQKRQAIEAIGLLFKSIHAPLYRDIDWEYWKLSCRDLGKEHDTNYRETHSVEYRSNSPSASLGADHSSLLDEEINKLRIAIRRVNHSIRTEKTYTDWVQKFLNFNRFTISSDIDKEGILKYLEFLAIERKVKLRALWMIYDPTQKSANPSSMLRIPTLNRLIHPPLPLRLKHIVIERSERLLKQAFAIFSPCDLNNPAGISGYKFATKRL